MKMNRALASSNALLGGIAQQLREARRVVRVRQDLEISQYDSGCRVEGYVDLELTNGVGLVWWLDISLAEEAWSI